MLVVAGTVTESGVEIITIGESQVARFTVRDFSGTEYSGKSGNKIKRPNCKSAEFDVEVWTKNGMEMPQEITGIKANSYVQVTGFPFYHTYEDEGGVERKSDMIISGYKIEHLINKK